MVKWKALAATLVIAAIALGTAVSCSDTPTKGTAPMISQLRVQSAQRISGAVEIVPFSFDYVDLDRDINRVTFISEGGSATNPLPDANQGSGTVGLQQAVSLPAAGTEVPFRVFVMDRLGNRSNELDGAYVAPN